MMQLLSLTPRCRLSQFLQIASQLGTMESPEMERKFQGDDHEEVPQDDLDA